MNEVFEMDLPSAEKFVLLVLAQHCEHDGTNAWPSVKTISKKTGLSERTVQRSLRSLVKSGQVAIQSEATITKPRVYKLVGGVTMSPQGVSPCHPRGVTVSPGRCHTVQEGVSPCHPNRPRESSLQSSKDLNPSSPQNGEGTDATEFEIFWNAYPKKMGRKDARRAWIKIGDVRLGEILGSLENWKRSPDWLKDGGQFIPYPATWLNKELWKENPRTAVTLPKVQSLEDKLKELGYDRKGNRI